MRPVPRAALALSLAAGAALAPAVAALAAGSGSVTTTPVAEAWYRSAPVCALPTGCPAEPPSPYSPGTLHVGVNVGVEEARTLLELDLSVLPPGTTPAGGQLRLPLATAPQDGTRAPEAATLRACLVEQPVAEVDGSFSGAPEVDCETVSVPAELVAATEQAPAAFTVDLTTLAAAWQSSPVPGALALVPGEQEAPAESWHLAFSQRTREGEGVQAITAEISYVGGTVDLGELDLPPVTAPADPGFAPPPAFSPPDSFGVAPPAFDAPLAAPPAQAPPAAAPAPQAAPAQVVPVAALIDSSFRYPAVFLLPLAFAVAIGWLGRALTRDLAADAA
jgi:hypothetical protein